MIGSRLSRDMQGNTTSYFPNIVILKYHVNIIKLLYYVNIILLCFHSIHMKNLEDEHTTHQLINSKKKCFKCL